jgi:probable F420-dependent oxidoreductase
MIESHPYMKFDVTIFPDDLNTVGDIARAVEAYGFDALWTAEAAHNPFLPLTHVASNTKRLTFGTAIAVAFPRSPMVTAQIAWDLAAQSKGRFMLGLGTQIKTHITKRFSSQWSTPVPRLREYVESMRAIWNTWQTGTPLRYIGESYKFTLMTPFFSPGAIENPYIPIYLSGVGEGLAKLAGETAQGFHIHPFHTVQYLQQTTLPAIATGAEKAGRSRASLKLACAIFVVTGRNAAEMDTQKTEVRQKIAFYASTPSYSPVLEAHGMEDLQERLSNLARQGQWEAMGAAIPDELLEQIAVIAPYDELAYAVKARYDGILDRVGYYFPFAPNDHDKEVLWRSAADIFST